MIVNASDTRRITASSPTATMNTMLSMAISVPRIVSNPALVPRANELATTTVTDGPGTIENSRQARI